MAQISHHKKQLYKQKHQEVSLKSRQFEFMSGTGEAVKVDKTKSKSMLIVCYDKYTNNMINS
jgi:hypothetical protein